MKNPKVSIITICLNDKLGLEKTINSVSGQIFRDFEHIVIDGGSTDGGKELLQQNALKFSYWISEKDSGIYNAMNKGIKNAKGEYCLFLNSGDYLSSDRVLSEVFSETVDKDILYGDLLFLHPEKPQLSKQPRKIELDYLLEVTIYHPTAFIKRSLFELYGLYDETFKIAADYEFFLRTIITHQASTFYTGLQISCFNTLGASSNEKFKVLIEQERLLAQQKHIPKIFLNHYAKHDKIHQLNAYKTFVRVEQVPVLRFLQKALYKFIGLFI